jgi:hypothetical protein
MAEVALQVVIFGGWIRLGSDDPTLSGVVSSYFFQPPAVTKIIVCCDARPQSITSRLNSFDIDKEANEAHPWSAQIGRPCS